MNGKIAKRLRRDAEDAAKIGTTAPAKFIHQHLKTMFKAGAYKPRTAAERRNDGKP